MSIQLLLFDWQTFHFSFARLNLHYGFVKYCLFYSKAILYYELLAPGQNISLNDSIGEKKKHFSREVNDFAVWKCLFLASKHNSATNHIARILRSSACRTVDFRLSIVLFYAELLNWLVVPTISRYWKYWIKRKIIIL